MPSLLYLQHRKSAPLSDTSASCQKPTLPVRSSIAGPAFLPIDRLQDPLWSDANASILTLHTPRALISRTSAADSERSTTARLLAWALGPRSLILTTTARPLLRSVTRTRVPNGSVRCAAVRACTLKYSPLAVLCPAWRPPYH